MIKRLAIFLVLLGATGNVAAQFTGVGLFVENKGQWPEQVKYVAELPGGMLFVEEHTLTYSFTDPQQQQLLQQGRHNHHPVQLPEKIRKYALKVNFVDAAPQVKATAQIPVPTVYNFFVGKDTTRWAAGARAYKQLELNNLYEGIDLRMTMTERGVKYDLLLSPGANPACIQMKYKGAEKIALHENRLAISTPYRQLAEQVPASFAVCDNRQRPVQTRYLLTENTVSFELEAVEPEEQVVIDPLLIFSTYSGSPSDNWGNTATYDEAGNAYSGGISYQYRGGVYLGEFPVTPGAYQTTSAGGWDVALLKFDSAGNNLLYATLLGGSKNDVPQSLVVAPNGDLYVLGITGSDDFPVTSNAYDTSYAGGTYGGLLPGIATPSGTDLFVARLSSDGGGLLGSTYLGGSNDDGRLPPEDLLARNYGDESRGDILVDHDGNIVIASRTSSSDFPLTNGLDTTYNGGELDGLLLKMSPALDQMLWGTYLGGSGSDVALSVKADSYNNLYVGGGTLSADFPVTSGAYDTLYGGNVDGWVAHISSSGDSLLAATFVGTTGYDQVFFLDVDASNGVYLAGQTNGPYLYTSGAYRSGYSGQFIHKLNSSLSKTIFSTTVNPPNRNEPAISLTAFLVNDCANLYLAGWGSNQGNFAFYNDGHHFILNTTGLPVTDDALQQETDGSSFYMLVLSDDASELLYATHLGSSSSLVHVDGGTSRFDKQGIVYHAVCASCPENDSSFPTTEGAYATANGSSGCNNAVFKFDLASLRARLRTNDLALATPGLNKGCVPLSLAFENLSTGGELYDWDFGDGTVRTVTTKDTVVHIYNEPGVYPVRLRAYDPNTCTVEDFAYATITVSKVDFFISNDATICRGDSVQLLASGGQTYLWSPAQGLSNPYAPAPLAAPADTTVYTVQIFNDNGCSYTDSLTVNVLPQIEENFTIIREGFCQGSRQIRIVNESQNLDEVVWNFGDGNSEVTAWDTTYTYAADGDYIISASLRNGPCTEVLEIPVRVVKLNIPNVITRNQDGYNDVFKITAPEPVTLRIFNRWGALVFEQKQYRNDWQGAGLPSGIYYYEVTLTDQPETCTGWLHIIDGH